MRNFRKLKVPKAGKLYIGIAGLVIVLNLLAWNSTRFSDAYVALVFPVWVEIYGRITGLFPFSVGEWMIGAGIILVIAAVVLGVAGVFRRKCYRRFYCFFAWVLLIVSLIMTLNCFMLYHASTFSENYFADRPQEFSLEELVAVRNLVAAECNRLSAEVERDEKGRVLYSGSRVPSRNDRSAGEVREDSWESSSAEEVREASWESGSAEGVWETSLESGSAEKVWENSLNSGSADGEWVDMEDKAREVMRNLGRTYPQLGGFYPRPKALLSSDFMCQQYMLGWYFPFSMEANYNRVAYVMNLPSSMCHELAHLKGYIYEDEASFISYLACVESDDIYFQYSGYLSVLGYLEQDLRKAYWANPEALLEACKEQPLVKVLDIVREDDIFVVEEEWERVNQKAVLNTEVVDKATDAFVDTTLKVNGVSDGMVSYSRVVKLLLQYYAEGKESS